MFEAGRKNTFADITIGQFSMSSEKKFGQALIME